MKRIILIIGILVALAATLAFGQITEGVITYEVKINMHRRLPPDRQDMKDMMPEFRTSEDQLFFNAGQSLYKPIEEDDEFVEENDGVRMQFRRPMAEFYTDQISQTRIVLQEFMGKKYRIEDTVKIAAWKFGAETKAILGYECKQATLINEERKQTITAWYTAKIRTGLGPENYSSLPGTILQLDVNAGERVITAKRIDVRALNKGEMKVPGAGTRISNAEFRKMMQDQVQRMGGNGNVIIRN